MTNVYFLLFIWSLYESVDDETQTVFTAVRFLSFFNLTQSADRLQHRPVKSPWSKSETNANYPNQIEFLYLTVFKICLFNYGSHRIYAFVH